MDNNDGKGGAWLIIGALAFLSLLLPGDIDINGFTMFIGIICVVILGISFFRWLYK